jgi:hypothetical protein
MPTKIIPSARPRTEGFWSLLRLVIRHCLRGGDGPGLGTPTRYNIPLFKNSALNVSIVDQTKKVSALDSSVKPSLPSGGDGAENRVTNVNQTDPKDAAATSGAAEGSQVAKGKRSR